MIIFDEDVCFDVGFLTFLADQGRGAYLLQDGIFKSNILHKSMTMEYGKRSPREVGGVGGGGVGGGLGGSGVDVGVGLGAAWGIFLCILCVSVCLQYK